jgi:hypothetical protein
MLLVAEARGRAQDVAAVERTDPKPFERPHHQLAQAVEAVVLHEQPEEVLVRDPLLVMESFGGEHLVYVAAVAGVRVEPLLTFGLRALAGRADVHHREPGALRHRERARVE